MTVRLTNVTNPAAYGVEWKGETGTLHQLVNIRGTASLMYGARAVGLTEWNTVRVDSPDRFGLREPPRSFNEFHSIARRFVSPDAPKGPTMLTLRTRYLKPTDTMGARILVRNSDGRTFTTGYDYNAKDPHLSAVEEYLVKRDMRLDAYTYVRTAQTGTGNVWTVTEKETGE